MKVIFLIGALSLLSSCSNLASNSKDTDECRQIAYGKHSEPLNDSVKDIFSECQKQKELLRKDENKRKNTDAWIDFFGNLFGSDNDSK
jgi:hypothetical protein